MASGMQTLSRMPIKPRILNPEFPIHITARTNGQKQFAVSMTDAWEVFSDYLFLINVSFGIRIHAFVMMPNHIHLIVRDPEMQLSEAMACFMRESSKEIGRMACSTGRLWGSRFHSSIIGSPLYYLNAYKYVYRNPVRARLSSSPFHYAYSTLPALVGLSRTILPIETDDTLFENFESAVRWLETPPETQTENAIRAGLRRRQFIPMRNESTKKLCHLEDFDDSGKVAATPGR